MSKVKILKVGDYVEVIENGNARVEVGEQGIVVDDTNGQESLDILFPARDDHWGRDEQKALGNYGWAARAKGLKLLYRPRVK